MKMNFDFKINNSPETDIPSIYDSVVLQQVTHKISFSRFLMSRNPIFTMALGAALTVKAISLQRSKTNNNIFAMEVDSNQ